jgi:hypothetical protein
MKQMHLPGTGELADKEYEGEENEEENEAEPEIAYAKPFP